MIIAHLPAGYLMLKAFRPARPLKFWLVGLSASLLPDLDILLFHLVGGPPNHRYYPTHWPLFWASLLVAAVVVTAALNKRAFVYPAIVAAGVMLHLLLDAVAGPVFYAAPFSFERPLQLIRIPKVHDWWFLNYARHWIFQVELAIWGAAMAVFGLGRPGARQEVR